MNQDISFEQEESLSSVSDEELQDPEKENKIKEIDQSITEDFQALLNQDDGFIQNNFQNSDTEQEEGFEIQKEQIQVNEPFNPREGQLDLFNQSKNENSIIYLPTGSGKTYIALMHIYYQLKKHGAQNVKIIFIANTIQLVEQQAIFLKKKIFSLAGYMENKNLVSQEHPFDIEQFKDKDFLNHFIIPIHSKAGSNKEDMDFSGWDYDRWMNIKNESTVLVMMGQMLLNALRRGYLKLPYFSLIIFDECHHCKQNHSYHLIMKEFLEDEQVANKIQNSDKVQILGLTASPVLKIDLNQAYKNSKIDSRKIEIELLELAKNLRSRYKFRSDSLQQLTQPNIQVYEAELGINIHQIDCENISKLYKGLLNLELDLQKEQKLQISYGLQLYLQQLINYAIYQGVIILKDLGRKSFQLFIQEMYKELKVKEGKLHNDQLFLAKIKSQFNDFLNSIQRQEQPKEMSPKFITLLNYLNQINDREQKIILFVDQKIIAKYINELLKLHSFNCNYVVGTGNNSSSSLQQEILSKHNTLQLINDFEPQNLLAKANTLYELFRDRDTDIENGIIQQNRNQDILKSQLQELSQGIEKLGKNLDQAVLDATQQKEIINQFKSNKFNILISTNVTEEGFDIPECNTVILFGETTTFKSYIQKAGRARRENSQVAMIVESSNYKKQKSFYEIIKKTLECIKKKMDSINEETQTLEQYEMKIKKLQNEINKENQNAIQTKDYYERALIKDSQALLNTNWAVEILSNYANVFRASDNRNYIKGIFYAYTEIPAVGFRCIIILPKNTVERFFIGDLLPSKEEAKRSAAFKAVKLLKIKNMLTADLRPIRSSIRFSVDSKDDPNLDNPQYKEIIHDVSIIKYEAQKVDMSQKLFPFRINSLNIEIEKEIYLYKFEFLFQSRQEDDCCWKKMQNTSIIGLIHDVKIQEPQIFIEGNKVKLERIGKITITEEEYKDLIKVHQFLVATQMDWDIEYYSKITDQKIEVNSCLFQKKKLNPFIDFTVDQKVATFVLLKQEQEEYQIDINQNQKILTYILKMKEVFSLLNNIKQKKLANKLEKQQKERLGENYKMNNQNWSKLQVEIETVELIKQNQFSQIVVQNISENYHLGKMVILAKASENNQPELDRQDKLRSIIRGSFDHSTLIDTRVLKKQLKKDVSRFLRRPIKENQRKPKFEYYMEEFYRFPLDLDICLKLRVLFKAFMPYVRDLFVAKQLQNNLIFNDLRIVEGQIYQYKIMDNVLVNSSIKFIEFLNQQDKKYRHLVDHFKKAINLQINFEKIQILEQLKQQEQIEQHRGYSIAYINDGLIFQALQAQSYNSDESTNYQVLEFLGDAILKLLGSIQVFVNYPFANEYIMHVYRAKLVSNENLRQVCILNKLYEYILSYKFDYYPQGFETDTQKPLNKLESQNNDQTIKYKATFKGQEIHEIPNNYQHVPDKVHSDVIEALNGTFMRYYNNIDACQTYFYQLKVLDYPTTDLVLQYSDTKQCQGLLGEVLSKLELIIGYNFYDQSLLIQALTHPKITDLIDLFIQDKDQEFKILQSVSLDFNFKTLKAEQINDDIIKKLNELQFRQDLTYDRLEFLGDSVLDAVVVQWLVQQFPKDHPEDLSLKKQCIVCNKALALVTLKYGLEYFLLHPTLHQKGHADNQVLEKLRANYDEYYEDISKLYTQEPTVKILGDVFEAIVGAIFVDCKFNFNLITQIIMNLMLKDFMEYFSSPNQIQKNPQDRLSKLFKGKNIQIRMTDSPPINGESEFVIQNDQGHIINKVRAVSEKQAREKILEDQEQERKGLK